MTSLLEDLIRKVEALEPDQRQLLEQQYHRNKLKWTPNPGGQTMALKSSADELFFGGEPGGGKSMFLLGLAITEHLRSIIFRREFPQIKGLEDEAANIIGSRDGYNGQDKIWRIPETERIMEFGSVPHEKDVQKYQGRAHDLKGFDELTHFSKSQYQYLTLWLRSTKKDQRCRIVATGNPPTTPEGLWVVEHWAPWLDRNHPDPAEPGELRWAARAADDLEVELFFRTREEAIAHLETLDNAPRDHEGNLYLPRSRTFIPGKLDENVDLARTGYKAVLAFAPKGLQGLATGRFEGQLEDAPDQVIPTQWIIEAQQRWTPMPPKRAPMTAIGVDVAQGGADSTVLSIRHDCWFAPLIEVPGVQTPMPSDVAALIVRYRRNNAAVVIDCGGGYGGGVVEQLQTHNDISAVAYKGSNAASGRSVCRTFAFANARAASLWRLREALDPEQPFGSAIALPNDAAIRADLAAPRFRDTPRGLLVESKDEIKKRIGRSPDKGDAIVMAWHEGQKAILRGLNKSSRNSDLPARAKTRPGPLSRHDRRRG